MDVRSYLSAEDLESLGAWIRQTEAVLNLVLSRLPHALPSGCVLRLSVAIETPAKLDPPAHPEDATHIEDFFTEARAKAAGLDARGILVRARNGLLNLHIRLPNEEKPRRLVTVGDVCKLSRKNLMGPNVGKKSVEFIAKMLATTELKLRGEE